MASKDIKSVNLLPEFLRTDKNSKFLSSTIDQLIQRPNLERIDGYIGSKITPNYNSELDIYISESLPLRKNYQLEPALIIRDENDKISDVIGIDDLANEITAQGGIGNNFDTLFRTSHYSYNPHIDWDKFINYQDYYWLTTGPESIDITGLTTGTVSTFTVTDNEFSSAFMFNGADLLANSSITLYRGNTYIFEVSSQHGFYIKSSSEISSTNLYNTGVTNNGASTGQVSITVTNDTPDVLFYIGDSQISSQGQFVIKTIDQATVLNVPTEIIGKKTYKFNNISLSNGMKIKFNDTAYPDEYKDTEYFVEGVGTAIKLVNYDLLSSAEGMTDLYDESFDANIFDDYPFDSHTNLPLTPEYITINRASRDLNPWTRYNRWVHKGIIETSATINGVLPVYPADKRAKRPIIEFVADLQLYNFGSIGVTNVDWIDTTTIDAFSIVEGSSGYHIDGDSPVQQGHRIIFNADTDPMVCGKVYQVNFVTINKKLQIQLLETVDHTPPIGAVVSVNFGNAYAGTSWWFNGANWVYAQQHRVLNEIPIFDLFDNSGISYSNKAYYTSNFAGNKIFSYSTGTGYPVDPVLGIQLKPSIGIGSYLFDNAFMSGDITITRSDQTTSIIPTANTYVKIGETFKNVWAVSNTHTIPVLQFQSISATTSTIQLTAVKMPTLNSVIEVFVDNDLLSDNKFTLTTTSGRYFINFETPVQQNSNVLFKIYSSGSPTESGYYELPLSLTNNPFNSLTGELTFSELSDHVQTMIHSDATFDNSIANYNNLRDLGDISIYGNRLISSMNPILFANFFIGKKQHSVIDAISKSGDQYNQFKLALFKKISEISTTVNPVELLDAALRSINADKDLLSPYYMSDMIAYGTDYSTRTWTVSDIRNVTYPIESDFNLSSLSLRSVLVYLNGVQLINSIDYEFNTVDTSINMLVGLSVGDVISVRDYTSTIGCFVPPTPSKLGLYPIYTPMIYEDNTYANEPVNVIQGHDGSITVAYNDYRDNAILEFEKRVYNNVKAKYIPELFDVSTVFPGAFRDSEYVSDDLNFILQKDFIKWAGFYGIDYSKNTGFDENNPFTWNYQSAYNTELDKHLSGYWRSVYKYFYDTDRPHTNPWEMLGFTEQPSWWESEYGPAPYTSGNEILWTDLESGTIRHGTRQGTYTVYKRIGLSTMLPVDEYGNLVDPTVSIASNITGYSRRQQWKFGDHAPAETAWRRSSYWPFALQRLLAITKPATYASLMYDTSRLDKNVAGQWTYGDSNAFLNLQTVAVHSDNGTLTSGYSVYVAEIGYQRTRNYITELKNDLHNSDVNLFYKVGGFVSKDKMQLVIDSYSPTSTSPGALLPQEDYSIILNTSNPIKSIGISGLIIQKINGKFAVKGYDQQNAYFTVYDVVRNATTPTITVGGISEPYVTWSNAVTGGNTGLSAADTTTAHAPTTTRFYQQGQIVSYNNSFYRVKTSHQATDSFNPVFYQLLQVLPTRGGATVQVAQKFNSIERKVAYGTEFSNIQEVYDLIVGYGAWLQTQGFIFTQFNSELNSVLDWSFTGKEFLYWTTQNWADNSVITLSPFADQLEYKFNNSTVDNIFDSFYEYNILQADGSLLPPSNLSVNRQNGLCTISILKDTVGMYFARLNSVQKEHALVFKNSTIFNDVIYDIESGYRQRRMKISSFRTKNWDGDYFSPGFIYDTADTSIWKKYTNYKYSDVVKYVGKYYSAISNIIGSEVFDFEQWNLLREKPVAELLPNFDYKINQFEDFYSLDIDNFDPAQQKMAQHLVGYTPRVYFDNIFTNPIAQYKFYQGFIKEKGTRNSISKLSKASIYNLKGEIQFTEEWAFRIGNYGSYGTYKELEIPLIEGTFIENPQIINFVDAKPSEYNDLIYYGTPADLVITPTNYSPSSTFMTVPGTYNDPGFQLPNAGYVRLDDVTATAYSEASLLDIANNNDIKNGDVIWIGFKKNSDWDVFQYQKQPVSITGVFVSSPASEITFVTDFYHELSVGDIISIVQFNSQVNGVYTVLSIPLLNQITVSSTLSLIVNDELPNPGLLFKFTSLRFGTFDQLPVDQQLLAYPYGTKVWVDDNNSENWAVYEKTKNYTTATSTVLYQTQTDSQLGWSLAKRKGDNIIVVGSPGFYENNNYGKVLIYKEVNNQLYLQFKYNLNDTKLYHNGTIANDFGYTVFYDNIPYKTSNYGLLFAGAPSASSVKGSGTPGTVRYSTGTESASSLTQEGAVKISSINVTASEEINEFVLLSPYPSNYERFGSSIYVQSSTTDKLLLVGAPEQRTTGTGSVYAYTLDTVTTSTLLVSAHISGIELASAVTLSVGSQWGFSISGSDAGSVIAVSAPGYNNQNGIVQLFSNTTHIQTITVPAYAQSNPGARFGETVLVSGDGSIVAVAAVNSKNPDQSSGKVFIYERLNSVGTFTLTQTLLNPVFGPGMSFGKAIDINSTTNSLIVSALGTNNYVLTTFDTYSSLMPNAYALYGSQYVTDYNSDTTVESTQYDSNSTTFHDSLPLSGTAYLYDRKVDRFVLADAITPRVATAGSNYGHSITIDSNVIYAGAPGVANVSSAIYKFNKINPLISGWNVLREQSPVVDISVLQKSMLINSFNEEVDEYLEVIDPLKGKIAGIAEQELKYKASFDPAVYSVGTTSTVNDVNTNWLDSHVGELWWDISTVKYMWYEQGELSYRKNMWGKIFPGATIDVYEWVKSDYLPSQWAVLADTNSGLTQGISGQPKYIDDSALSIKQIYNPTTNSFENVYFYWVKNKVTLPTVKNRRVSAYQVSSIIADPVAYGLKFIEVLSNDAVAVANVGQLLIDNRINLNISLDIINNDIPKHTEWLLLQEGSEYSVPNVLLEKKLLDSLLGHDKLGNPVPSPTLSSRERYGIGIRPQQTFFKNRYEALRNLIEFTNSVLIKSPITGNYSFTNLNKMELVSNLSENEYDQIVEDISSLDPEIIDTKKLSRAELSAIIQDGKIRNVIIVNPGYGYKVAPTVTVIGDQSSENPAIISTGIDEFGRVITATVTSPGTNFNTAPVLEVRLFTVIVESDQTSNGKWSKYAYDIDTRTWTKTHTQQYNTTMYWDYIDWSSSTYNQFVDYEYTIDEVYQLAELADLVSGQYVKIKNGGDGRYIIVEKTVNGVSGNFSNDFNLVYSQRGTIQLSDNLWNYYSNNYGFDQTNSFDQTLFDQTPDIELENILIALKNDIFINELKINWNLFFFKAVKYALSEQKLLDWAFKTSFVNVKNIAGSLDQRPVYKLKDSGFYEDYLREVKPYHTNIRSFTVNYDSLDPSNSYTTDFDLPAVYDNTTNQFNSVEIGDTILDSYPWKSWYDNYTCVVGRIVINDGGSGYLSAPTVIIQTADGDTGSGATASAYISANKVTSINVDNPGSGYTVPPSIILVGGDSTTAATAYSHLTNEKVRSNTIGIKFDRITSSISAPTSNVVTDTFMCNGETIDFVLSWLASYDKLDITIKLNGNLVLGSDYSVITYSEEYNSYSKKFNKITFLNYVPANGDMLTIEYTKSIELLSAVDRISMYYTATTGMPGLDLPQLMTGIEYPRTSISGIPFDYSTKWDVEYQPFGMSAWADDVAYYSKFKLATSATSGASVLELTTSSGVTSGQSVNFLGYITNKFNTSSEVVITSVVGPYITLSAELNSGVIAGDEIELWAYDANAAILDSSIYGGTWSLTTSNYLIGALGINPADTIVDGDGFFTQNSLYAPEELVPGNVIDSVGINVYTKNSHGAPMIFSGDFDVIAGEVTFGNMGIEPPGENYVTVVFNNTLFVYNPDIVLVSDFTASDQFGIDWETNQIIIPPQTVSGKVGYTILGIGGGADTQAGVIDHASVTVDGQTTAQVQSLAAYSSINSAYVTVNGISVARVYSTSQYGYILKPANDGSKRAAVEVNQLPVGPEGKLTVQAWFFTNNYRYFNEVREQIFTVSSTPRSSFNLSFPPGNIEPAVANIIVEVTDLSGRRRLRPPYISYYDITSSINTTFLIDSTIARPSGTFDVSNTKVYLNGAALRPGFDFTVSSIDSTVTIYPGLLSVRDVVAVVGLPAGDYDYNLIGSTVVLTTPIVNSQLKVITYTDHDDMVIRTERFIGSPTKRYKITRPIINDNYVWVQVNGTPLTSRLDYEVLDDQVTIQISDNFTHTINDSVVIMSMSSRDMASTVLGYRIFNDIFNRTHFKRLSKNNTTYLTSALKFTDTSIYIADAEALTPPIPSKKIPGIILIDGERIEFNKIEGNVLTQLRRSTLGTSPSFYSEVGTKVIDQGVNQTIPFSENNYKQTLITTATTNVYQISTVSNAVIGDGITLSTSTSTSAIDQVSVYYGGKQLRKFGTYHHDISLAYDSPLNNIIGTTSTVIQLPITTTLYDAYVVTATNQVWVYTNSIELDSVKGYVYRGLNYLEPEFSINTATQELILNVAGGVSPGLGLTIIKRDFARNTSWNDEISPTTTESILNSTTIPARFLQAQPAELPDKYYYGGDPQLTDRTGVALTDENDQPLQGF